MDARLSSMVREVLQETHQEHLVESVVQRLLRSVREFHARAEMFEQDTQEATFAAEPCAFDDVLSTDCLAGMRKVIDVIVHMSDGTAASAKLVRSPVEYFKSDQSGSSVKAFALRLGNRIKVKSSQQLAAITVIYNAPPEVTRDNFNTWLTRAQLDFAVNDAIGMTMAVIGDDAANLFLRKAEKQLLELVDSLATMQA